MDFYKVSEDIYKLDIPYEDGFTSSFALYNKNKWILADFGATENDVYNIIVPAAEKLGFYPEYILCSHSHPDHCGGLEYAADAFPKSEILTFSQNLKVNNIRQLKNGEILLNRYKTINLKGHTDDGCGVLDTKNGILLSFDCLQQYGIGNYGINLDNPKGYIETLETVSSMNLNGIISSHAYYPKGFSAFGCDVKDYIEVSRSAYESAENFVRKHKDNSPEEIARIFAQTFDQPKVSAWTFMHISETL